MSRIQVDIFIDVCGETCPIPLIEMRKAVMKAQKGQIIEIKGTHEASRKEIPMAVNSLGLELLDDLDEGNNTWRLLIKK
ncbi:sulfurtransferase TusA family protein [bacterium]|nr:sulfurtransferase TusA family protein [bacterium]